MELGTLSPPLPPGAVAPRSQGWRDTIAPGETKRVLCSAAWEHRVLHFASDLDVQGSGIVRADGGSADLYVFGIGAVPCAYPVPGGVFTLDVSNPVGAPTPATVSLVLSPGFLVREEVGLQETLLGGAVALWVVVPYARSVELYCLSGSMASPVLVPGQMVKLPVMGSTITATAGAGGADVALVWNLWR